MQLYTLIMVITSLDNAKLLATRKLADKKYRRQTGNFVAEGERLVADAVRYGADIETIFVKESLADKFLGTYPQATVVADKAFATISDTVNSQGIVAVCHVAQSELQPCMGNCLVLDGLQDPGNVGTLLRTAAATGFDCVYAANSVDLYSPKVLRSAMGAHFCLTTQQTDDLARLYDMLAPTHEIVCADMGGNNVYEESFVKPVALVVGNEGNGLSELSRARAAKTVSLPMTNKFESLNAAVAGSVLMYHIVYGCKNR